MTGKDRPQTGRAALRWAVSFLKDCGWPKDKAQWESRLLLGHAQNLEGIKLVMALDEPLAAETWELYRELIERLSEHEPLQYLTGRQDFMGLTFKVSPGVLIPRWDTETLVREALQCIAHLPAPQILDLGTGSGAIAVSLAYYHPGGQVWAVDISPAALEVAKENAAVLEVGQRITFLEGDLFQPLPPGSFFDLIVSNPPYISEQEYQELDREVKKEPYQALVAADNGLVFYRRIAGEAGRYLKPGGWVLVEIGWKQGEEVSRLFAEQGFRDIQVLEDLAGRPRVVAARSKDGTILANK